jgi:hypothetical protein
MTRDDIVREMAQAEQHAEAALVALAAAYQQRGDLLHVLVRGAYNGAGSFRAFDVAHGKLSQDRFARSLVSRMRELGLAGMVRHRVGHR